MFSSTLLLLLVPLVMCGALPASPEDPCYQKGLNCFFESTSEIGHFGFLPDIWSCEMACRDESACKWFTWYKQDGSTCATSWVTVTAPSTMTSASLVKYLSVLPIRHLL